MIRRQYKSSLSCCIAQGQGLLIKWSFTMAFVERGTAVIYSNRYQSQAYCWRIQEVNANLGGFGHVPRVLDNITSECEKTLNQRDAGRNHRSPINLWCTCPRLRTG